MSRGELVDAIATKTEITKKDADTALTAVLEVIVAAVSTSAQVTLVNFGSFARRERQARKGHNLRIGKKMQILAIVIPAFYLFCVKLFKL